MVLGIGAGLIRARGGLPTNGLQLWLNGRTGITTSGGLVTNWADQSGNGRDFSQSNMSQQPTTGTINGNTAISFTASSLTALKNITITWGTLITSTAWTISMVWQYVERASPITFNSSDIRQDPVIIGNTGSEQNVIIGAATASSPSTNVSVYSYLENNTRSLSAVFAVDSSTSKTVAHYSTHQYDGTNVSVSVNGDAATTSATGVPFDLTNNVEIGKNDSSASAGWNGFIGEILVYNRVLSAGEITTVEKFLKSNWGF